MRALIDSATLLWWFVDDPRLGDEAREAIEHPGNEAYVSAASAWETAIKHESGKLALEVPIPEILQAGLMKSLPVLMADVVTAAALRAYDVPVMDARA